MKLNCIFPLVFIASVFHTSVHSIEIKNLKFVPSQFLTIQFGMVYTHWFSHLWEITDVTGEKFYGVPAFEAGRIGITASREQYFHAAIRTSKPISWFDISPVGIQTIEGSYPVSTASQYPQSLEVAYNMALRTIELMIFRVYNNKSTYVRDKKLRD